MMCLAMARCRLIIRGCTMPRAGRSLFRIRKSRRARRNDAAAFIDVGRMMISLSSGRCARRSARLPALRCGLYCGGAASQRSRARRDCRDSVSSILVLLVGMQSAAGAGRLTVPRVVRAGRPTACIDALALDRLGLAELEGSRDVVVPAAEVLGVGVDVLAASSQGNDVVDDGGQLGPAFVTAPLA
jgi:hypothetical protein